MFDSYLNGHETHWGRLRQPNNCSAATQHLLRVSLTGSALQRATQGSYGGLLRPQPNRPPALAACVGRMSFVDGQMPTHFTVSFTWFAQVRRAHTFFLLYTAILSLLKCYSFPLLCWGCNQIYGGFTSWVSKEFVEKSSKDVSFVLLFLWPFLHFLFIAKSQNSNTCLKVLS